MPTITMEKVIHYCLSQKFNIIESIEVYKYHKNTRYNLPNYQIVLRITHLFTFVKPE